MNLLRNQKQGPSAVKTDFEYQNPKPDNSSPEEETKTCDLLPSDAEVDRMALGKVTPEGFKPWQFQKGQSGNPKGRPKKIDGGKPNRMTILKQMFDEQGHSLVQKALELAIRKEDTRMIQVCLSYVMPAQRQQSPMVDLELPEDATASERLQAIQIAATSGKISADVAAMLSKSIKDAVESEKVLQAMNEINDLNAKIKNITTAGKVV